MGSKWKVFLVLPLAALAFILISCSDKEKVDDIYKVEELEVVAEGDWKNDELFYVVEEMPTFNGGEPIEFRKYIAQNVKYPKEAAANGVSGKIIIKFIVTKTGKVIVPDEAFIAKQEGVPLDEVVVTAYRTIEEDAELPDEKYIQMLKDEVIRLVSSSPDWTPGKQRGKAVNVQYTFPVTFALQ